MKWLSLIICLMIVIVLTSSAFALECNEVITEDTKMLRGMICATNGIVIGADDITIDCNGKSIEGLDAEKGIAAEGRKNIEIKDCIITGFSQGIYLNDVENGSILRNEISDNENGIEIRESSDLFLTNNAIEGNNIGIGTYESRRITIFDNVITQNQRGIVRYFFTDVNIDGNIFDQNLEDTFDFNEIIPGPEEDEEEEEQIVEEPGNEEIEESAETPITPEELLTETIYLEYRLENINEDLINMKLDELGKTSEELEITREITYEDGKTNVKLTIIPKKKFKDVEIYEKIPKCFAVYVDLIVFEKPPEILIDDPLIKWHFEELEVPTELVYSTADMMPEECEDLFQAIGLGEIVKPNRWWFALVVLVLVSAIVIYFARFTKR